MREIGKPDSPAAATQRGARGATTSFGSEPAAHKTSHATLHYLRFALLLSVMLLHRSFESLAIKDGLLNE
jgi:hypothetical protein